MRERGERRERERERAGDRKGEGVRERERERERERVRRRWRERDIARGTKSVKSSDQIKTRYSVAYMYCRSFFTGQAQNKLCVTVSTG